jgi:hypothetical protein
MSFLLDSDARMIRLDVVASTKHLTEAMMHISGICEVEISEQQHRIYAAAN